MKLDFSGPAEFSGLGPLVQNVLASRGLLNANVDVGVNVPQQVMASMFHQMNDRWAVLGSVGWQQWSRFGQVQLGIDSSNPTGLTTDLDFKDTWHVAAGAEYRISPPWLLNFGVGYDSAFQDSSNVSPSLPANSAWRFGVGAQNDVSKTFSWGIAGEYAYGGTLDVNQQSAVPVALGGRGNLVGSYNNTGILFLGAYSTGSSSSESRKTPTRGAFLAEAYGAECRSRSVCAKGARPTASLAHRLVTHW